MTSTRAPFHSALRVVGWAIAWTLIVTVLVFLVIRVTNDVSNLSRGVLPPEGQFDRRYAENPVIAYLHIVPGVVYLLGAPLQLSRRFRAASFRRHRRVGRIVLIAGLVTGTMAIVVGIVMPFGGMAEASASFVFGIYFVTALGLAFRAIRGGRSRLHRRWMIRAFALGTAVGLIRIVVGVATGLGFQFEESFGPAFWIAFVVMAILAELWLWMRPDLEGVAPVQGHGQDPEAD